MQQDPLSQILGAFMLPLFVMLVLGSIAGIKGEAILGPFFQLIGALLSGVLRLFILLLRALFRAAGSCVAKCADKKAQRGTGR
jgi:hypothetical protein